LSALCSNIEELHATDAIATRSDRAVRARRVPRGRPG